MQNRLCETVADPLALAVFALAAAVETAIFSNVKLETAAAAK